MNKNKNTSTLDVLSKVFLTIIAIPIGFMLGLIDVATKKKW